MALAFPTAVGHAKNTRHAYTGGANPDIIKVTNLNDTGPGSMRAALEASGNRVIIPEVSGRIDLSGRITIGSGNLHLAGQTSPAPGLTLYGLELRIEGASNVFIEHIRIIGKPVESRNYDGVFFYNASYVYLRHCTILWAEDEPISLANTTNVTFDRCLIEGKRSSNALDYWGAVFGWQPTTPQENRSAVATTLYKTLFVNTESRNPKVTTGSSLEMLNVFFVNIGSGNDGCQIGTKYTGDSGAIFVDLVEGATILGPESNPADYYVNDYSQGLTAGSLVHIDSWLHTDSIVSPTVGRRKSVGAGVDWDIVLDSAIPSGTYQSLTPVASSGAAVDTVADAYTDIIVNGNVGSRPADTVQHNIQPDLRILTEARNPAIAVFKDKDNVVVPTYLENTQEYVIPDNPYDDSGSGYTNLEVALAVTRALVEPETAPGQGPGTPGIEGPSIPVTQVEIDDYVSSRFVAQSFVDSTGKVMFVRYIDTDTQSIVTDPAILALLTG